MTKIKRLKTEYSGNNAFLFLLVTLTLFPILPEYVSPFLMFANFIVFKKQWTEEGKRAVVGTLGKLIMIFMGFAVLSTLWSGAKMSSLATAGLWWGMFLMQIMIYNLADTKAKINEVLKAIVLPGSINGVVGLFQIAAYNLYKNGAPKQITNFNPFYKLLDYSVYTSLPFKIKTNTFPDRASGFFSNPNLLASYEVFVYPISIYLFLNAKTKKQKTIYFFLNLFVAVGISTTLTRAGCAIVLAGYILIFVVLAKRHFKQLATIFIPTFVIIIPSLLVRYGLVLTFNKNSQIVQSKEGIINSEIAQKSTINHFGIWRSVFNYITHDLKTFLIGLGFGVENTGNMLRSKYNLDKPHAHNFVLETWCELGIFATLLLLAIIVIDLGKLIEINVHDGKRYDLIICMFASTIMYCLFGMTDYIFNSPKQIVVFMIMLGLTQAISDRYDKDLIDSPDALVKIANRDLEEIKNNTVIDRKKKSGN